MSFLREWRDKDFLDFPYFPHYHSWMPGLQYPRPGFAYFRVLLDAIPERKVPYSRIKRMCRLPA
jgi:hypothetical protein